MPCLRLRAFLLPSILLLAFSVIAYADPPSPAAAEASFAAGKFDSARKTYASLVKADPKNTAAWCGLAETDLRLDLWRDALKAAASAVAADPKSAEAFGLYALTEIRAGEPEAADADAKTALSLDKDSYFGLVASGRLAAWNGHDKDAYALFKKATALHPEQPDAWLGLIQNQNDSTTTDEDLAVDNHYLALKPHGQPFDFTTPYVENTVVNESTYWKNFHDDPAFHLSKDDEKESSYAAIFPIQRDGSYILVSVGINGKPLHLLFDSGADEILLSTKADKRLGLPEMARSYVSGMQGRSAATLQKADTLTLGAITLHSIPIHATGGYDGPGDGIFGGTLLHDYVVTLDFENDTMTIARGKGAKHLALPHTSVASMPLHEYDGHLFVSAHTQKRRVWALVDTGAETDFFSLDLTHVLSADTPKADWHEGSADVRSGIGDSAMEVDYCVTPQKVVLTFDGSTPPATLTQTGLIGQSSIDHQLSPTSGFEIGLMLGIPVLSQHNRVTIDYPNHLLTFEDPLP